MQAKLTCPRLTKYLQELSTSAALVIKARVRSTTVIPAQLTLTEGIWAVKLW